MEKVGLVKLLSEIDSDELLTAGGKGANLGEMINAGLPVPEGFVLLADSYREFVEANELERPIEKLLDSLAEETKGGSSAPSAEEAQVIKETTEEIKGLCIAGKIPEVVREEIDRAYEALGRPEVAVRSSATAEDLPGASFAGQYSTYLNIRGRDELYEAVKSCWASLWNERAVSYRARQGIGSKDLAHGVVVQKLIDSEKAGIIFTANPVNGRRDQVSLSSSWGLGEAIVSGEVEPDQWVIEKNNGHVLSEDIAVKKVMTVRRDGGSELAAVEEQRQAKASLNEAERNELVKLALDVEKYFASPQDIEWACEKGRFYLVQTRPITALFPLPESCSYEEDLRIYANINMGWQAVKDPFTPLGFDFFEELTRDMVSRLSRGRPNKEELDLWWFHNLAGRMFIDMTDLLRMERFQNRLKQKSVDPLDREPMTTKALLQVMEQNKDQLMAGDKEKPNLRKLIHPGLVGLILKMIGKAMYGALNPSRGREKAFQLAEKTVNRLEAESRTLQTVEERLKFIEDKCGFAFLGVTMSFFYGALTLRATDRVRVMMEKNHLDTTPLDSVGKALPYNVTTEMGMDLLRAAKSLDEKDKRAAPEEEEITAFMDKYGHKSSFELDVGIANWKEEPGYILDLVNYYIDNKDYDQRIEQFYREQQEAEEAIKQVENDLKRAASWRSARRAGKMLRGYRQLFGLREVPKFYGSKAFGIFRAVMIEAGEELAAQGRIEDKMDIFYLTRKDIRSHHDLKTLVDQKKPDYFRDLNRPAPRVLTSTGESIYAVVDQVADNAYRGIAVSPGVYEGKVKILADPSEGSKLDNGDILVTVATNPAWTPLFLRIGALVMETGGSMSHGSIVSREYGLPAVAGVANITTELKEGQNVRVNGETGIVEILD